MTDTETVIHQSNTGSGSNRGYLEHSSAIIGLLSAATIYLSVVYDWAYFSFVGLKFFSLMTIGDHIATGLAFFPPTLFVYVAGISLGMFGPADPPTDSLQVETVKGGVRRLFRKFGAWFLLIFLVFVMFFLPFSPQMRFVYFVILFLILMRRHVYRTIQAFGSAVPDSMHGFLSLLFLATLVVGMNGMMKADIDLSRDPGETTIVTTSEKLENARMLRITEKGYLVRYQDKILILPSSEVQKIEDSVFYGESSYVCAWFHWCFFDRSPKS